MDTFEPKIVGFLCNWCSYTGADLAGTSRIKYAPNVRVVKVMCSGRVDPTFVIKALMDGADGVLIAGCHPGDCHFTHGNYHARRRWMVFRALLDFTGIPPERVIFSWISAAEGSKFADLINSVTEDIRKLGPFDQYQELIKETESPATL